MPVAEPVRSRQSVPKTIRSSARGCMAYHASQFFSVERDGFKAPTDRSRSASRKRPMHADAERLIQAQAANAM
jgi:hypothetical protein